MSDVPAQRTVLEVSMGKLVDIAGKRFGCWTVLAIHPERDRSRHVLWRCCCDCGQERVVRGVSLRRGNSTTCGCVLREIARKRFTKHGLSRSRAYRCWDNLLQRCFNPQHPWYAVAVSAFAKSGSPSRV